MQIYLLLQHAVLHNCHSLWTEYRECFGFSVRTRRYFDTHLYNLELEHFTERNNA